MRLFYAALALEANTFLPLPTSYQAFVEKLYFPPGQVSGEAVRTRPARWTRCARARKRGEFELIEGSCYAAQPGGAASRAAYERMRDEILGQLKAALPVDGAVFNLHGAMVAHGYDDCEGDFLERVRALVGETCVIGVELDPHCHLTEKRCALADVIVLFKEYPHTDFAERGEEVVDLVLRTIRREIKPVKSVFDCRMIASFPTSIQPMRGLVDRIMALEGKDRVLSVSIGHCFPYGDVPECGARILVHHRRRQAARRHARRTDRPRADRVARAGGAAGVFGRRRDRLRARATWRPGRDRRHHRQCRRRRAFRQHHLPAPPDRARRCRARRSRRSGTRSRCGSRSTPAKARGCRSASAARPRKCSGPPVDAEVEIIRCVPNAHQTFAGAIVPLGDVASIRMGGVEAVLISTRAQAMGSDLFSNFGIDPKQRKILVVKSNQHFYASFSKIAAQVIYAEGDGALPRDYRKLPWRKIQRPIWPLDAGNGTAADHLTRSASPWPNSCKAGNGNRGDRMKTTRRNVLAGGLAAAALTCASLDHHGARRSLRRRAPSRP